MRPCKKYRAIILRECSKPAYAAGTVALKKQWPCTNRSTDGAGPLYFWFAEWLQQVKKWWVKYGAGAEAPWHHDRVQQRDQSCTEPEVYLDSYVTISLTVLTTVSTEGL